MIRAEGLTKSYGGVPALAAVTFRLEAAGSLAVCGPSGCGKSTLLRIVAGLEVPDGGTFHLNGLLASGGGVLVPPHRRGLSVCFQRPALWPHLTVEEHLRFPLEERGRDAARVRAAELLEAFGLEPLARRRPEGLSGGEARRVSLARALAPQSPLLLLDEPFAHLDAAWRERARERVRTELEACGATLLLAVHSPQDAGGLCAEHLDLCSPDGSSSP
jgi:iron(III) transport system ATP-binding protein